MTSHSSFEAQAELANTITACNIGERFSDSEEDQRMRLVGEHALSSGILAEVKPDIYRLTTDIQRTRWIFEDSLLKARVEPTVRQICVGAIRNRTIFRKIMSLSWAEMSDTPGIYKNRGTFLDTELFVAGIINGAESRSVCVAKTQSSGSFSPSSLPRGYSPDRHRHRRPKSAQRLRLTL